MIEIARCMGLATVQDGGRRGFMHAGVPRGGALAPDLLADANAAAGNAPDEAAIEAFGAIALVAHGPVRLGVSALGPRDLAPGARLDLDAPRPDRVRYIALRGGIDVSRVLGGRGTLLVAKIGGLEGRALRAGDRLDAGHAPEVRAPPPPAPETGPIRVILGPDDAEFPRDAVATLLGATFVVSATSDRTGTRLVGPRIAGAPAITASRPMVRGAIEVTPTGEAIVLGPDHPTTGGYSVIACVASRDFGRFMRLAPGAPVRFSRAVV